MTDERNIEDELRQQLQMLQTIIDTLPASIFIKDTNRRFIFVNKALAESLQCDPKQVIGKTDWDLFQPTTSEQYQKDDADVLSAGKPTTNDELTRSLDGKEHFRQVTKVPILNEHGDVTGILGVSTDVSALHQHYKEQIDLLREKERLLKDAEEQLSQLRPPAGVPRVFVSYKHSTDDVVEWVKQFATDLIEVHGVDCILDQFDLDYGDSIQAFMQRIQTEATHVLLILTTESVGAIEANSGGVAFEAQLAAARRDEGAVKLIPVLRGGKQTPAYVKSHLYVDFRNDSVYLDMLKRLADSINGSKGRPVLGRRAN